MLLQQETVMLLQLILRKNHHVQISETHFAKTWMLHPDAPSEPPDSVKKRIRKMSSDFKGPMW